MDDAPVAVVRRMVAVALPLSLAALVLTSCSGPSSATAGSAGPQATTGSTASSAAPGDPAHDKLAQVLLRGTLVLSTDLAYAPQSMAVDGASRTADTKCQPTELTGAEVTGYDAETGKAVAKALGVEPCFVTPQWTEIIAGGWGDRWDISWGSGAITADRMTRLFVTQPSYSTPAGVFVAGDSSFTTLADLSGRKVGACTGCTMEQYLKDTLVLPGVETKRAFDDPQVSTFDNEIPGLEAVAKGKIDGFLCSEPVGQGEIDKGLDLRMIEQPAYQSFKTGYVDRESGLSSAAFVAAVDKALAQLHRDGTLKGLSVKFFGKDYATAAGEFNLASINQEVS
jgi:polar amino acid transport system substrate-binding protein